MKKSDRIKLSLLCCSEKHCDECLYNRWKERCQVRLCRDALNLINELEYPKLPDLEQLKIDI